MSFCLKVYHRPRSKDFDTVWINSSMTPKDVIQILRVQSNLMKSNEYGLMITKARNKFKWLNEDEKFGKIIIDEEDEIFTQPYSKLIAIELPDLTCIKRKISIRSPIENVVKELCFNLSIYPYEIWGAYIDARGEKILLIPNQSISEQAPDVERIYLKQYLFPDNLKPDFLSPSDLYILQYRSMLIKGEFGNEAEDQIFLKGKSWYISKDIFNGLPNSETPRRKELLSLFSLKSFGSVSFIVRFHETIGEEHFHSNEKLKKIVILRKALFLSDIDCKNSQRSIIPFAAIKYVGIRDEFLKITSGSKEWHFTSHRSSEIDVIICQLMKNYNFTIPLTDFKSDIFLPRIFHSFDNQIYFLPNNIYTTEDLILEIMSNIASKYTKLVNLQKDDDNEYSEEYSLTQISMNTSLDELENTFKNQFDDGAYKIDQINYTIEQARSINSSEFEDQSDYLEELKKSLLKLNELLNKETENLEYRHIKKAIKRAIEPNVNVNDSFSRRMNMSNQYNSDLLSKQKGSTGTCSININGINVDSDDEKLPQRDIGISSTELYRKGLIGLNNEGQNDLTMSYQSENEKDESSILPNSLSEQNYIELIEEEEEESDINNDSQIDNKLEDIKLKIDQFNQTEKDQDTIITQSEKVEKKAEITQNPTSSDSHQDKNDPSIENNTLKYLKLLSNSVSDEEAIEEEDEEEEEEYSNMYETTSYDIYSTLGATVIYSKADDESKDDDPLSQFDSISENKVKDKEEKPCILMFPKIDQYINQNVFNLINKNEAKGSELNLGNQPNLSTKKMEISEPESKLKLNLSQPEVQVEIGVIEPTRCEVQVQNEDLVGKIDNLGLNEISKKDQDKNNEQGEIVDISSILKADYYQTGGNGNTEKEQDETIEISSSIEISKDDQDENEDSINTTNYNETNKDDQDENEDSVEVSNHNETNKNDQDENEESIQSTGNSILNESNYTQNEISQNCQDKNNEQGEIVDISSILKADYYQTGGNGNTEKEQDEAIDISSSIEISKNDQDENEDSINTSNYNETNKDDQAGLNASKQIEHNESINESNNSALETIENHQNAASKDEQKENDESIGSSDLKTANCQNEDDEIKQGECDEAAENSSKKEVSISQTEIINDHNDESNEKTGKIDNSTLTKIDIAENKENGISTLQQVKCIQTETAKDNKDENNESLETTENTSIKDTECIQTETAKDSQDENNESLETTENLSIKEAKCNLTETNKADNTDQSDSLYNSTLKTDGNDEIEASKDSQSLITDQIEAVDESSQKEGKFSQAEISKDCQTEINDSLKASDNSDLKTIDCHQNEIIKDDQTGNDESVNQNESCKVDNKESSEVIGSTIAESAAINQIESTKNCHQQISESFESTDDTKSMNLIQNESNKDESLEITDNSNPKSMSTIQFESTKDDHLETDESLEIIDNTKSLNHIQNDSSISFQTERSDSQPDRFFFVENDEYNDESSSDIICSPLIKGTQSMRKSMQSSSKSEIFFSPTKRKHETKSKLSFVMQDEEEEFNEDDIECNSLISPQSNRMKAARLARHIRNDSLVSLNNRGQDRFSEFQADFYDKSAKAKSMSRSHFAGQSFDDSSDFESEKKENEMMMKKSSQYNEEKDCVWNSPKVTNNNYNICMNAVDNRRFSQRSSKKSQVFSPPRQNQPLFDQNNQIGLNSPSQSLQPSQFQMQLMSQQNQPHFDQSNQIGLNSPSQSLQPNQFQMQLISQQNVPQNNQGSQIGLNSPSQSLQPNQFQMQLISQQMSLQSPSQSQQFQMQQASGIPVPCFGQIPSQFGAFNQPLVAGYPLSPGFYSPSPAASPSAHIEASPKITVKVNGGSGKGSNHHKNKKNKKSHKKRRQSSSDSSASYSDYSYDNESSSADLSVSSDSDDGCETTDQLIQKIDSSIEKVILLANSKKDPANEVRSLGQLLGHLERKFDGTKKGSEIKKLNRKIQKNLNHKSDKKSSLRLADEVTKLISSYFAEFRQFMKDPLIRKNNDVIKIASNNNLEANDLSLSLLELQKSLINSQNCSLIDQSND